MTVVTIAAGVIAAGLLGFLFYALFTGDKK